MDTIGQIDATEQVTCGGCGFHGRPYIDVMPSGVHWGRALCQECQRHLAWVPKPESDSTKYRRPAAHRKLVQQFGSRLRERYESEIPSELGVRFCELCLATEESLAKGRALEAHHIIPYKSGGPDDSENVWILCTRCHRLIEWVRRYRP